MFDTLTDRFEGIFGKLRGKGKLSESGAEVIRSTVTETLLVIDATTGQNGLVQAREFTQAADLTGVVLTKLDGSAKGGIVVAVQNELNIPVKLVGLGEGPPDLIPFTANDFVDALLDKGEVRATEGELLVGL